MLASVAAIVLALQAADAMQLQEKEKLVLPSARAGEAVPDDAAWRVQIDDRQFYAPDGHDIKNFFYTYGHEDALTEEMRAARVARYGRYHVYRLEEPSRLQVPNRGDRRHAHTQLLQLRDGMSLQTRFPPYVLAASYKSPLDTAGEAAERAAGGAINTALVKGFYDAVVGTTDGQNHHTRSWTNGAATRSILKYMKGQFSEAGLTVCEHNFGVTKPWLGNMVGFVRGTENTSDTITLGAHYDSRPFDGNAPGAEDNGSGVAALLAVLKAFEASGIKPKKNIYFVAFAAEEPGLVGSDMFAKQLKTPGNRNGIPAECRVANAQKGTHRAIAIDEVGWRSPALRDPTVNLETFDWTASVMDHLAAASRALNGDGLRVVHSNNPFGSDHMSWLDRKMPGVLVINGDDEGYPDYHQSTDTMDHVSLEYTVQIARMIAGGLLRMASA